MEGVAVEGKAVGRGLRGDFPTAPSRSTETSMAINAQWSLRGTALHVHVHVHVHVTSLPRDV